MEMTNSKSIEDMKANYEAVLRDLESDLESDHQQIQQQLGCLQARLKELHNSTVLSETEARYCISVIKSVSSCLDKLE
jgi:hypothetical protein